MKLHQFMPESPLLHVKFFWTGEEAKAIFYRRVPLPDQFPLLLINCGAPLVWEMPTVYGLAKLIGSHR